MNMINGLNAIFQEVILQGKAKVLILEEHFTNDYSDIIGTQEHAPQISIWDGITMGGGVGISVHGKWRVCTEKTIFAKPETAIGFFPDVGGSYFLSRLSGSLGPFVGITGWRLNAKDLLYTGIATHYIKSENIDPLKHELASISVNDDLDVSSILDKFSTTPGDEVAESSLIKNRKTIDKCFRYSTMEEIVEALKAESVRETGVFVKKVLNTIAPFSPAAMKQTLMLIHKGKGLSLKDCLEMEFNLCQSIVTDTSSDFYEGVRAVLVDKDRQYNWKEGATLEDVDLSTIEKKFQSIGERSLVIN
eukprot:g5012.t1